MRKLFTSDETIGTGLASKGIQAESSHHRALSNKTKRATPEGDSFFKLTATDLAETKSAL
jgi:hypothetical protein